MNQCHFEGHICADPETRHLQNDKRVTNFRIAVDRTYKKGDERMKETSFLDMEAWDTGGDLIEKHFKKGDVIIVHCSVKQEEWEDKNGGGKRSKLKFRVNSFDFPLGNGKKAQEGDGPTDSEFEKKRPPGKGAVPKWEKKDKKAAVAGDDTGGFAAAEDDSVIPF